MTDVGSALGKARIAQQSASQKRAAEAPRSASSVGGKGWHFVAQPDRASTRSTRVTRVYNVNHYGSWSAHPYQADPYHPMLTGYLLGRLSNPSTYADTRAWVYHHYDTMDPVRREELFRENAQLRADIAAMRARGVAVDASYALPGVDDDIVYSDSAAVHLYPRPPLWTWAGLVKLVVLTALVVFAVYAIFFHRWNV